MDHIRDLLNQFLKDPCLINQYKASPAIDYFNDTLKFKYSVLKDTQAVKCSHGTLFVLVRDSFLMQEVGMFKSVLIRELNQFLKISLLKEIRLTLK